MTCIRSLPSCKVCPNKSLIMLAYRWECIKCVIGTAQLFSISKCFLRVKPPWRFEDAGTLVTFEIPELRRWNRTPFHSRILSKPSGRKCCLFVVFLFLPCGTPFFWKGAETHPHIWAGRGDWWQYRGSRYCRYANEKIQWTNLEFFCFFFQRE